MADGTAKRMMQQRQPQRIVSGQAFDEDARIELSVRPKRLDEYIGQKRVKENIQIAVDAARSRGEALDHVLLYGPPGLGKTTLAQIIANELNVPIKTSAGPLLERKGDLTAILASLQKKEVFFLDEIHRLQPALEEVLQMLGVDENGLDEVDRNLMLALLDKYAGGPVGLGTLAAVLSEEEDAIEEMYEPYLMQIGMIDRTPRGRVASPRAYEYFGRELPRRQPRLF